MSCITQILKLKGDEPFMKYDDSTVVEGGGIYKGYEYLIIFVSYGHRCGYVALKEPETERFLKEKGEDKYYYPDLDCHGDVTFFEKTHRLKSLLPIPCDDFWIGFDAAHCWDKPCVKTIEKYFGNTDYLKFKKENAWMDIHDDDAAHRSYKYMELECLKVIDQLTGSSEIYEHE